MQELEYIYGKTTNSTELREVKCKLPVNQLVALHGMKILKGRTISAIVAEALENYFEGGKAPATETA